MYVHVGGNSSREFFEMLPIFVVAFIVFVAVIWFIVFFVMKSDDKKELITRQGKILEKPVKNDLGVEWYVVEFENGERTKLRSFRANSVIISVGDTGIIKYRGKTIQEFERMK